MTAGPLTWRPELSSLDIVLGENPAEAVSFAAAELQRYLFRMAGVTFPIMQEAHSTTGPFLRIVERGREVDPVTAGESLEGDAFILSVQRGEVRITAARARGVLFGAYRFLHLLGCRWLGPADEVVPVVGNLVLPLVEERHRPTIAHRDLFEDATHVPSGNARDRKEQARQDRATVDWMAKVRFSGYFPFRWDPADSFADDVVDEIRRRDLDLIGGGHVIPFFLSRGLFAERPELFRMNDAGKRMSDGNICASNPEALEIVGGAAVAYVRSRPSLAKLYVWGDDVIGGSWCNCERCTQLTPQAQYLTTCNAVLRALRGAGSDVGVTFLAYMDSLVPDTSVEPLPGMNILVACRERCYRHAIGAEGCERNAWHLLNHDRWQSRIPDAPRGVFDYYSDLFLLRSLTMSLGATIEDDVRDYAARGVERLQIQTMCPFYSFWAQPLTMHTFAACAWDGATNASSVRLEYCEAAYGPAASCMEEYWALVEQALARVIDRGDLQEFVPSADESLNAYADAIRQSRADLARASALMEAALEATAADDERRRLTGNEAVLRFTTRCVDGLEHYIGALHALGLAESGHRNNLAARTPVGTYLRLDLASATLMTDSLPLTPRGYHAADRQLTAAIEAWEDAQRGILARMSSLPSLWLTEPGGFLWHHRMHIRDATEWRKLVAQRIAEYDL